VDERKTIETHVSGIKLNCVLAQNLHSHSIDREREDHPQSGYI
jgi:hypothetical protein